MKNFNLFLTVLIGLLFVFSAKANHEDTFDPLDRPLTRKIGRVDIISHEEKSRPDRTTHTNRNRSSHSIGQINEGSRNYNRYIHRGDHRGNYRGDHRGNYRNRNRYVIHMRNTIYRSRNSTNTINLTNLIKQHYKYVSLKDLRHADLIKVRLMAKSKRGGGQVSLIVGNRHNYASDHSDINGSYDQWRSNSRHTFDKIVLTHYSNNSGEWFLRFHGKVMVRKIAVIIKNHYDYNDGGYDGGGYNDGGYDGGGYNDGGYDGGGYNDGGYDGGGYNDGGYDGGGYNDGGYDDGGYNDSWRKTYEFSLGEHKIKMSGDNDPIYVGTKNVVGLKITCKSHVRINSIKLFLRNGQEKTLYRLNGTYKDGQYRIANFSRNYSPPT